jgi:serine/threonine protein kinase
LIKSFAAPEVLRGERYGGKETDVWALGVLMYVLMVGECPFCAAEEVSCFFPYLFAFHQERMTSDVFRFQAQQGVLHTTRAYQLLSSKLTTAGMGEEEKELVKLGIDLVERCLEIESIDRPTGEEVMRHGFIVRDGWTGKRGWEQK